MNNLLSKLSSTSLFSNFLKINAVSVLPVRTKKVKAGGNAHNRRRITPGKHRRIYVQDGEWVEQDHLLVRQLGLQFYPGENVIFCENNSLKARFSGHVIITMEKLSPYPFSPLYSYVESGNTVERKFVHVIPPPRKGIYKLVDRI